MTDSTMMALNEESAISVFTGDKIDRVLLDIEKEVMSLTPDTSTAKGRKEIASTAYKVSQSKTALDSAGKTLVSDWKAQAKLVDASRKQARDFLDNLRDKVRLPLTEWEDEEKLKVEQARLVKELEDARLEAIKENELFDREKAIAEKERLALEAEQERLRLEEEKQAESKRIEEEKRLKAETLERERKLKEESAEDARKQAEHEAQNKIDEANKLRLEEEERARKAEVDRLVAIEKAKEAAEKAENDRLAAIKQAEIDKQSAIKAEQQRAIDEAARVEQDRIEKEAESIRTAKVKAENRAHKKAVNNKALKCFKKNGIDNELAKSLVIMIAEKKIDGITINY